MRLAKFFQDKHGQTVLYQTPNPPLILAVLAGVASLLAQGAWRHGFRLIAYGSLFCWAWLELSSGVTPFRRTLGGVVLTLLATAAFVAGFVLA